MDESLAGLDWLVSVLQADSSISASLTGGIWPIQAPMGVLPPFCVVTPMGGHDVTAVAGYRLMFEGPYQVRFWGYTSQSAALRTVSNNADALLQAQRHQTTPDASAEILSCLRDNPLTPLPDTEDQLRIGIGGLYRLQVRSLT